MCPIVLRVDVPDQGLTGPQGAHQRVFATHAIEVAGPQQVVKVVLCQVGQWLDAQRPLWQLRVGRQHLLHRRPGRPGATSISVGVWPCAHWCSHPPNAAGS